MMWLIIIGSLILMVAGGIAYLTFRSAKFSFVQKISRGKRWLARLICLGFFISLTSLLYILMNLMNALVCLIHLVIFWMICDLTGWIVSLIRKKKAHRYWAGAAAILLCVVYLAYGWYSAHHIRQQSYQLETEKGTGHLRIVQISDSHLGTTFHADKFGTYIDQINALSPDVVVITGDFVDDDTSREDMLSGCGALGKLQTKYGVFFVFGNHDKGYNSESSRGWSGRELKEQLEANNVIVLQDDVRLIDGRFYIVGRRDRSEEQRGNGRIEADQLLGELDHDEYIIVLDHQPYDFEAEAAAGADLVLCGHTHGGQLIPIRHVGEWIGENALRYGYERIGGTDFIVTSGIGSWAIRFKTGCWSEYVAIDIRQERR